MTWRFCSGVDDAVLVDRWREESDLWLWICGGGGDEVVIESIENVLAFRCCFRGGCVANRGGWWWLMRGSVGSIGFRGVWCWWFFGG